MKKYHYSTNLTKEQREELERQSKNSGYRYVNEYLIDKLNLNQNEVSTIQRN